MTASDVAILMALRVKGRATRGALAAAARLPDDVVGATLDDARARGVVGVAPDGEALVLTDAGRAELVSLLHEERVESASLADSYDRFLRIDRTLKERISAWQLANGSTAGVAVPTELRSAGAAAVAIARELVAVLPRLGSYAARLGAALGAIERGDTRFVASPHVDSLHQVWFELHEDLLVTLGRTRAG